MNLQVMKNLILSINQERKAISISEAFSKCKDMPETEEKFIIFIILPQITRKKFVSYVLKFTF